MSESDRPDETDEPRMSDLFQELQQLEETVDSPEERKQVRETLRLAMEVEHPGLFGRVVKGFGLQDAAQAFLGALLFGIPMFVEGGTNEVGMFIHSHPLYLLGTHIFGLVLIIGILYVADIQDVRIQNPVLGFIPRRLIGVVGIALGTSMLMMTLWGRVDWAEPLLAFSQATVAYIPMSIGASLGDILPD